MPCSWLLNHLGSFWLEKAICKQQCFDPWVEEHVTFLMRASNSFDMAWRQWWCCIACHTLDGFILSGRGCLEVVYALFGLKMLFWDLVIMEYVWFGTMVVLTGLAETWFSWISDKGGESLPGKDNDDKGSTSMIVEDGDHCGDGMVGGIGLAMESIRCESWFEMVYGVGWLWLFGINDGYGKIVSRNDTCLEVYIFYVVGSRH